MAPVLVGLIVLAPLVLLLVDIARGNRRETIDPLAGQALAIERVRPVPPMMAIPGGAAVVLASQPAEPESRAPRAVKLPPIIVPAPRAQAAGPPTLLSQRPAIETAVAGPTLGAPRAAPGLVAEPTVELHSDRSSKPGIRRTSMRNVRPRRREYVGEGLLSA